MTDHVFIPVTDLEISTKFYDEILGCLGYKRFDLNEFGIIGYARPDKLDSEFCLVERQSTGEDGKVEPILPPPEFHIGFEAPDEKAVHVWHKKAIEQGGKDIGQPELQYPGHYSAYIVDPDGWTIEARYHSPKK